MFHPLYVFISLSLLSDLFLLKYLSFLLTISFLSSIFILSNVKEFFFVMMKTYTFSGYFLNGSGQLYHLSDWSFSDDDYYFPHQRALKELDYVSFLFDNPVAGMFKVKVFATGLKQALSFLRFSLIANRLNLVLSCNYSCLSNGRESFRTIRLSLDDV